MLHLNRNLVVTLVLAAPMCLGACAPEAPYEIKTVFDPCAPLVLVPEDDVEPAEKEDIAAGIALWNERVGSRLTLDDVPDAPRLPIRFDPASGPIFGHYDDEKAIVLVNETMTRAQRTIIVAHEVGHAFGLLHVDAEERPSVMNHGNRKLAPNAGDADAVAAMWGSCE